MRGGRALATAGIVGLLAIDLLLPRTGLGRRGHEAVARAEVESAGVAVGDRLPLLGLRDLEGRPLSLVDFRGHPLLVTFERSVDW